MLFHVAKILLLRPLLAYPGDKPSANLPNLSKDLDARKLCVSAALSICKLLEVYREHFGLHRVGIMTVFCAITAGVMHLESLATDMCVDRNQSQGSLSLCRLALGEMSQTFRCALRGVDLCSALRHEWQDEFDREHRAA